MINELSIIIPCLNEENYLPKLLQSIIEQNFQGKLQIIVVDGNSEDKTVEVAKSFNNKIKDLLIIQTKRRIASQRNLGAKKARYKYLLFSDADIILPDNFLEKIFKKITPDDDNFVCSFLLWCAEFNIRDYLALMVIIGFFLPFAFFEKPTPGALMFTTKSLHKKINGFNESMLLAEDLDYGERAVKAGAKYHLFLTTYALHSTRRLRKMGRRNFFLLYLKGYIQKKRFGLKTFPEKFYYPFGHYDK